MNRKSVILITITLFAVGRHSAWSRSSPPSPQPQDQPRMQLSTKVTEQRSLLRHCLYIAELAGKHADELLGSAAHGRPNVDQIRQHLREVRSAVDSMSEDHKRFLYGLTEEQWKSAKGPITALEQIRVAVQVQLEGVDLELQMPTPDRRVFARYGRRMKALLEDWRKQHRKMVAAVGIKI